MLGLIEDYDALYKQISWGQTLLAKMDIQTQEALSPTSQKLGPKVTLSARLGREMLPPGSVSRGVGQILCKICRALDFIKALIGKSWEMLHRKA